MRMIIIIINNNTSKRAFMLLKGFFLATVSLDPCHPLGERVWRLKKVKGLA